jgi:hypothetical protein
MLAGLLFATHDADDRPDQLAATLPFAGTTLIEYQARLLVAAGASQLVIGVSRLTPELLGAIGRIARRGVAVDAVRSATEAAAKLHPLGRIVMLADGLVTTDAVIRAAAAEGGDLLLVGEAEARLEGLERLGGGAVWAGVARFRRERVEEVSAMPRDYDLQSALLRVVAQAGAEQMALPVGAAQAGHGVERRAAVLDRYNRAIIEASVADRGGWYDRWVTAPIARFVLPRLIQRRVTATSIAVEGLVATGAGLATMLVGPLGSGLLVMLLGTMGVELARTLASLRDEASLALATDRLGLAAPAAGVLALGVETMRRGGGGEVLTAVLALVVLAALAERAGLGRRERGWGSPVVYLAMATLGALASLPLAGVGLAAGYAAVTAAMAVERLRRDA